VLEVIWTLKWIKVHGTHTWYNIIICQRIQSSTRPLKWITYWTEYTCDMEWQITACKKKLSDQKDRQNFCHLSFRLSVTHWLLERKECPVFLLAHVLVMFVTFLWCPSYMYILTLPRFLGEENMKNMTH
jgi:hypothetical protein